MKNRILVAASFFVFSVLTGYLEPSYAEKQIEWRLSHWFMPSGYVGDGYKWFSEEVQKRTGDRLHIEVYPNGALGFKNSEALSFAKKGNVELVSLSAGATSAEEPLIGFSELPFLFPTEREGLYWIKWVYDPILYPHMEKKWNVKLLGEFRFPPVDIWAKYKIDTIDDCQGKKLRCYGGVVEEAMKAVGFATFSITVSELIPALQQGLIESLLTTVVSASETKVWDAGIKYRNMPDMVRPMFWLAVNLDAFNALPEDIKGILVDTGRDFTNYMFMEEVRIEEDFWHILADNGVKLNPIPIETRLEMAKRVRPVWRKMADRAGPEATKLLKDLGKY
jgi:TRAP-type C4-dicarboxylate transport system substrate-binding protein